MEEGLALHRSWQRSNVGEARFWFTIIFPTLVRKWLHGRSVGAVGCLGSHRSLVGCRVLHSASLQCRARRSIGWRCSRWEP